MKAPLAVAIALAASAAYAVEPAAPVAPPKAPPPNIQNRIPKELGPTTVAVETLAQTPTAEMRRTIYDGGNLVVNPPGAPVTAAPGKDKVPGLNKAPEVGAAKDVAAPEKPADPKPPLNDDQTIGFTALGIFAGGFIGFALGGPVGFLLGALLGTVVLVGAWRMGGYKKKE